MTRGGFLFVTRIRSLWLYLFAATCLAPSAAALPPIGPSRYLTGSDLFNLEWASDPQISPDGRTIAYVRQSNDIMTDKARPTIWLVDIATGQQRPLLAGSGAYFSPRWSPDGSRLAYVAAEGASPQLYVRWLASGESARITGLPDSPGGLAWSPDGRRIAYSMLVPDEAPSLGKAPPKPEGAKWADPLQVIDRVTYRFDAAGYLKSGYRQIFWVPSDGGAPTQLTFGPTSAGGEVSWTPDGRSILFSANLSPNWQREPLQTEVYKISIEGGAPIALTSRDGPDNSPAVSPDGRHIAWVGFDDKHLGYQNRRLYVMNLDGSGKRMLTGSLDRSVSSPAWAGDNAIYVEVEDRGVNRVERVGLDGSIREIASDMGNGEIDRPYAGGDFSVSKNGLVALTSGDPLHPNQVAVVSGNNVLRLTRLSSSLLDSRALAQVQKLTVKSAFDQRPIDAWMVTPPEFDPAKKYPLIL